MPARPRGVPAILSLAFVALACNRDAPKQAPPPPAVSVALAVEREVVDWDEFTGQLEPEATVELRARVGGYLIKADFQEGKIVEADQVLFQLDPATYKAEFARTTGQVQQAEAQAENTAAEFGRIEALRKNGGGSEKEFQDAKFNMRQAAAALASAKAAQDAARDNLEWTNVRAGIRGKVSDKRVVAGNMVTGGSATGTLLTTIVRDDPIYCVVYADERSVQKYAQLSRAKKRISARDEPIPCFLKLQSEADYLHEGTLNFVDNTLDRSTGTVRASALFANPDHLLQPGYFARVRVPGSGRYRALLVPESAVDTNQSIKFLRVLKSDDTVEYRTVKIGTLFGGFRVIEEGLAPDERVVVNGLQRAFPGVKVKPETVTLDASKLKLTAPGSAATQALPATRHVPATGPATTPAATRPADTHPAAAAADQGARPTITVGAQQ